MRAHGAQSTKFVRAEGREQEADAAIAEKETVFRGALKRINQSGTFNYATKANVTQPNTFLAEFTIENRTAYAIKDLSITCDQIALTGTIIQSHEETIYDIIKPTTRSTYAPIPFGSKHRQTQPLQCQITNFTVHNSE